MDYAAFKAYVLEYLWNANNTELVAELDNIIQQATNELERLTGDWQIRQQTTEITCTSQDFNLTTTIPDFKSVRSLINTVAAPRRDSGPMFSLTTPEKIYAARALYQSATILPVYAVDQENEAKYLRLVGPFTAENPAVLRLNYLATLPDHVNNPSWLSTKYLDLYVYTVFKHCALFLREDARVKTYSDLQLSAMMSADVDDKHNEQWGASPKQMSPHRVVP